MPDTYSQIYIQIVFAVKGRENLIAKKHREELHKFIAGIIQKRGQKLLAIFVMPDHAHVFIGMTPVISVSDLVRDIKAGSSKFLNDHIVSNRAFNWQQGYGAFSYSQSQLTTVIQYILNQENIIKRPRSKKNILICLTNSNLNSMKNICLNGWNKQAAPSELVHGIGCWFQFLQTGRPAGAKNKEGR